MYIIGNNILVMNIVHKGLIIYTQELMYIIGNNILVMYLGHKNLIIYTQGYCVL